MALPVRGGTIAGQIWLMLGVDNRYRQAGADERPHLIAEASLRAYIDGRESPCRAGVDVSSARPYAEL